MPPKRKKRFHGLYYHSSPPRVLPMNGQGSTDTKKKSADDFSVRLSTIRIWMHEKDIGKLTRVLWAGQGNRLRQQASTNPRVKRFLAAVPYVMNTIKDVHQSVVDNSLETLQTTMEPPVPPSLITSKDLNGLNVIHKAAGLGHTMILEYLLSIWPDGVHETDMTGKTPLHWAASAKNNMRCYTLLTQAGCEEDALDYKMKTPAYYKQKHNEIERSFLTLVPEAPRVSQDIPTDWDALANDDSDERKKPEIKIPNGRAKSDIVGNGMNLLTSRSEANSIENTSEPDLFEGDKSTEEASEPQPPEPIVNGNEENPSENNHLEDSVGDNSEPPSPPKTPEEKTDENHNEDEGEVDEPPQPTASQQEDENVSIALSDQNNDNTNDNNEETEEGNDKDNYENGDSNENDKSEGDDGNIEEVENSEDTKENDVNTGENNNGDEEHEEEDEGKSDENPDVEEVQGESGNEDEKEDDEDVTGENSKSNEQDDVVEKDDETNSVKENNEENSEETGENKTESQVRDDETTEEGNDHTSETEQENETESTPLEDSQTVEEDSENIQPERPKTHDENPEEQNDDSPQTPANETSDEERDAERVETKNKETQESQKENDDDDDAQDTQIETLPEPPTESDLEKDENENIPEFDDKMATDSPTSSLAIEGYVLGDSEDNQVQSESAAILDDEEKYIQAIINAGDMEQLAALVLNGDGIKILNRTSSQPEIQAFLNNVPAYMNKISRVHEAARQGTLYQLQSALDRRKFAIAKDAVSPCGASPLHVAVLFGHTDIVRYLAGRFPETTSAVDDDGRTPLHYAATIKDNGHFFNLLCHLGGNPKAVDKLGHTAEFYTNTEEAKDILTYKKLLQRFGAETLEDEMLSDQVPDDQHSSRRNMVDVDLLSTLERCFSVIHEASKNLSSASASALATRSPATPSSVQVSVTCYLGKFLRRSVFDKIKKRQTRLDHNLFDVIWPAMRKVPKERRTEDDLNHGVVAPDYDVYVVFQEFMVPLIKDMHCMNMSSEFKPHPRISYFPFSNGERMTQVQFMLDDESKLITHCTVECSRNLEGFELPLNLNVAQIEQAERAMMAKIFTTNFAKAIGDHEAGNYYTLNEVMEDNSTIFQMLDKAGLMIPLFDLTDRMQEGESLAINGQLWPYGRGVFVNVQQNLALWLNCQEHLRVISSTKGDGEVANIGKAYTKVGRAVTYLEINLHFKESYLLGYLVSRPSFLGTGLKMTTTIQLPNLLKEVDNLRHLCSVRGLLMNNCASKNLVSLVNMQSLGSTEITLFRDYCTALTNIISLEKDMSLTNSKHIATMLVKIFRRKKNSLVDRN